MQKTLLLALAPAVFLQGCVTLSTVSVVKPVPATVPQSLRLPCAPPVALPTGALSSGTVARFWATDRTNLNACGQRQAALSQAVTALEEQGN